MGMGHCWLVLISDHASGTLRRSVLTQAEKGWTSRMVQGTGSPSLGQGSSGDMGWEPGESPACSVHQRWAHDSATLLGVDLVFQRGGEMRHLCRPANISVK